MQRIPLPLLLSVLALLLAAPASAAERVLRNDHAVNTARFR
jgi:hypothetical protein